MNPIRLEFETFAINEDGMGLHEDGHLHCESLDEVWRCVKSFKSELGAWLDRHHIVLYSSFVLAESDIGGKTRIIVFEEINVD